MRRAVFGSVHALAVVGLWIACGIAPTQSSAEEAMVDRFGQSRLMNYPAKVAEERELQVDARAESECLANLAGPTRDAYGGLLGSKERYRLEPSGFFRLAKVEERDVLVTPDGNIFFQLAVCALQPMDDYTVVRGRESKYEWLPPQSGDFASAWHPKPGTGSVSFYLANWIRKYGKPFSIEEWSGQYVRRLRAWGFNSGGAWSPPTNTTRRGHFPYTPMIPWRSDRRLREITGTHGIFDPFSPDAPQAVNEILRDRLTLQAEDPLIIGYFLGNEQLFENVAKIVCSLGIESDAKKRLVKMLEDKYHGDVESLNAVWQPPKPFRDFEEALRLPLKVATAAGGSDLGDFERLFFKTYYELLATTFRRYDKNHLLLGSRWQPGTATNRALVQSAAKYVDVISVNYYSYAIEEPFLKRIHNSSEGRPLLLSEWYHGTTETGLGGGQEVGTQAERGRAYRSYVESAANLSYVVGHQWFSYVDQSVTGRYFEGFNGEGNNNGLVNVVDRPYEALVAAAAKTNHEIYDVVLRKRAAYQSPDPRFMSREADAPPRMVNVPRAISAMKIDGIAEEWPGRPAQALGANNLVEGKDAGELNGAFRLCWDEDNLYVFIQVHDLTPLKNRNAPSRFWSGDCLELFLGAERSSEGGALGIGDEHLLIAATGGETRNYFLTGFPADTPLQTAVSSSASGDGYAIEAAIPWAAFHFVPANQREFLFDIAIDDSADGLSRVRQLVWNGSSRNSSDRGAWGRARLINN